MIINVEVREKGDRRGATQMIVWFVLLAYWITMIPKCHLVWWQMNWVWRVRTHCSMDEKWLLKTLPPKVLSHCRPITVLMKENDHHKPLFSVHQPSCSYVSEQFWSTVSCCCCPIKICLRTPVCLFFLFPWAFRALILCNLQCLMVKNILHFSSKHGVFTAFLWGNLDEGLF